MIKIFVFFHKGKPRKPYFYSFQITEYSFEMKYDEFLKRMKWSMLKMKWNEKRKKNELFAEENIFIILKCNEILRIKRKTEKENNEKMYSINNEINHLIE